jgi:hypothetical protein
MLANLTALELIVVAVYILIKLAYVINSRL